MIIRPDGHWLCSVVMPNRYPIVVNSRVAGYMETYVPYVEWFGGRLVVSHKQIIWNEFSNRFNFIILWHTGFLFRTWIKLPMIDGFQIVVRIGHGKEG
jgi:hypothetical protein